MLGYRDTSETRGTRAWLQTLAWEAERGACSVDACRDRCVDMGELEAALVDALCPSFDRLDRLTRGVRVAGNRFAKSFVAALHGERGAAEWQARGAKACAELLDLPLPARIRVGTPEGFAYYGLYPEQYVRSTELALAACRPERVVVLGLRSIGTTLASVVEACVERHACPVTSYVLRPHGDPFDRTLRLAAALEREISAERGAHFFIVDEGPGLSGSSLTCVASRLRELGVTPARIVFLPSYACDGRHFVSERARRIWSEHVHFAGEFDVAWISEATQGSQLRDLSAGAWQRFYGFHAAAPVIQPQHERRKYLALDQSGVPRRLLRFAGFGRHGASVRARAEALQQSGVTPKVVGFANGMLAVEHVPGRPLTPAAIGPDFLRVLARYLAFRQTKIRPTSSARLEPLAAMARQNIDEALGGNASKPVAKLMAAASAVGPTTTIVDGRLFAHEWLVTSAGFKKVDAFDHGDDHFYPGPCDIAWDVAGAGWELRLAPHQRRKLASLYATASGDASLPIRLPFFELAYLAHRVAYTCLAARALRGTATANEFTALQQRYTIALAARLSREGT
jgi:hypothetical protein